MAAVIRFHSKFEEIKTRRSIVAPQSVACGKFELALYSIKRARQKLQSISRRFVGVLRILRGVKLIAES